MERHAAAPLELDLRDPGAGPVHRLAALVLAEGRAVAADEGWTALTGVSVADTLGTGWLTAVHVEDRTALLRSLALEDPGSADVRLRDREPGWTRWWWRTGTAGSIGVHVADIQQGPDPHLPLRAGVLVRPLADRVIHQAYAAGLLLAAASADPAGAAVHQQITDAVELLDGLMVDMRDAALTDVTTRCS